MTVREVARHFVRATGRWVAVMALVVCFLAAREWATLADLAVIVSVVAVAGMAYTLADLAGQAYRRVRHVRQ